MTAQGAARNRSLTAPFGAAVALHAAAVALLVFVNTGDGMQVPPPVRMHMMAAPVGAKDVGVVAAEKPAADKPVPARTREAPKKTAPVKKAPPQPKPKQTTANVPKPETTPPKTQAAPKAGSTQGGKGSDVANIKVDDGIDFPYRGYLENITNQILKRFEWDPASKYRADVSFRIRRDGTIAEGTIRVVTSNGSYAFKTEAMGAIEAAGNAKSFGKLPDEFPDDVLSIVFTFEPSQIRK